MTCRHLDAPATPMTLRIAPQLAVLAVLDEALISGICALVAEHPDLAASLPHTAAVADTPAGKLHEALARCSLVLADYRLAIAEMIALLDEAPGDIPF